MQNFIRESKIKKDICDIGQKMYDKGFVAANDGNISVRLTDDIIIVTPTGISKGGMKPAQMVKMNLNGDILSGHSRPSSEVKMHIEVYRQSKDIHSVVHAHPPISTAFAAARRPLDKPIISEAIYTLGVVPVSPYATPGTKEVPESVKAFVKDYNALLLANHGLLTWGEDITQAFFRMESAEQYAKILYYLDNIGEPKEIPSDKVEELVKMREKAGIMSGGIPQCSVDNSDSDTVIEDIISTVAKKAIKSLKKR